MILVGLAWADPLALRAPMDRLVVVAGLPDLGAGAWATLPRGRALGVAVGATASGTTDLALGVRDTLYRAPSRFGVEVGASLGAGVPLPAPRPYAEATAWLEVGWRGAHTLATVDLALPVATDFHAVRVPVLVEPWLGARLGAWSVAAGAGLGPVFVPGELTAFSTRWSLAVGWVPPGGISESRSSVSTSR